jgi:hypothetical protein
MQMNVEQTLLIRMYESGIVDAFSECDRRRREAATAEVNAELEKEFGPPNKVMADPADAMIQILHRPKWRLP